MKDYLKQELYIGDDVIFADTHGRNAGASLGRATVAGFTPKNVRLKYAQASPKSIGFLKSPEKVVKIEGSHETV